MNTAASDVDVLILSSATLGDGPDLTRLLKTSYQSNSDFTVRDEAYFQDHFSGRSVVLTARSEGQLIGTMSASLISCSADLGYEDEGMLTTALVPALYLSRAATVSGGRTSGINSLMRLYCIEAALELGLQSIVGFVYQEASRTRLMAALGYSFSPLSSGSNSVREYHSQCLFATLLLKTAGKFALDSLRDQCSQSGKNVKWQSIPLADALIADRSQDKPIPQIEALTR